MPEKVWIEPRDKPGLLCAMMKFLAGDARISFEGDLSRCDFSPNLRPHSNETSALVRQTAWPIQDFVVLPLGETSRKLIQSVVLPDRRCIDDIIHIQIERCGELQFGAYDNFHRDCVVAYSGVPLDLIAMLHSKGVIRSWVVPPPDAHRWHD